ncbi:MAG: hypothetical protein JW772_01155 [Candidatus Diapherotrites archaeon]|nr:hypothetical protein [Candidatus Diapherotrites archaeon]
MPPLQRRRTQRRKKKHRAVSMRPYGFEATKKEFASMRETKPLVVGAEGEKLVLHDRRLKDRRKGRH